jgi:hypothetical protein
MGAPMGAPEGQQGNGMAVAGLVLGIIGLVFCWVPFLGWILALLGIIFGGLGMGKANKIGGRGKGLAVGGLVCGVLGLVIGVALFFWALKASRGRMRFGEVQTQPDLRAGAELQMAAPLYRS